MKYGGKTSSLQRVQYGIFKDIMQVIKMVFPIIPWQPSWDSLINVIDQCHHQSKITMVCWNKPKEGIYKINSDDSSLQEFGKIGSGGIL